MTVRSRDRGLALVIVLLATMMLTAIGVALATVVSIEVQIARSFRDGQEAAYAVEAGLERAIADLARLPDWHPALSGEVGSAFADGTRQPDMPGGGPPIDLDARTRELRQGSGRSDMWARTLPAWQLFAWGPLAGLQLGGRIESRLYVAVWIADDPADGDGNGEVDANGIVMLHAEVYGYGGAHRRLEAEIGRSTAASGRGLHVALWHELR